MRIETDDRKFCARPVRAKINGAGEVPLGVSENGMARLDFKRRGIANADGRACGPTELPGAAKFHGPVTRSQRDPATGGPLKTKSN